MPTSVTIESTIGTDSAQEFWLIYDEGFRELNKLSPCRQSFYEDEFMAAMASSDFYKVVLWEDDQMVSMAVFGSNLKDFPWISDDYFQHHYPTEHAESRLFYFVALLTTPNAQRQGKAEEMLEHAIRFVGDRLGVALLDVCEENSWLPEAIHDLGTKYVKTDRVQLGVQTYWALPAYERLY